MAGPFPYAETGLGLVPLTRLAYWLAAVAILSLLTSGDSLISGVALLLLLNAGQLICFASQEGDFLLLGFNAVATLLLALGVSLVAWRQAALSERG